MAGYSFIMNNMVQNYDTILIHYIYKDDGRSCQVCGIHFKYPSKLDRHLQMAKHRLYEANYCGGEVSAAETNSSEDHDTLQEPTIDTNVSIVNHGLYIVAMVCIPITKY